LVKGLQVTSCQFYRNMQCTFIWLLWPTYYIW